MTRGRERIFWMALGTVTDRAKTETDDTLGFFSNVILRVKPKTLLLFKSCGPSRDNFSSRTAISFISKSEMDLA